MDKKVIGIIVAVAVLAAAVVWWLMRDDSSTNNSGSSAETSQTAPVSDGGAAGTSEEAMSDMPAGSQGGAADSGSDTSSPSATNSVTISNFAYSPAKITVKKGTTVTWTNQDSMGHNVVATNADNTGGLPTSADLLGQGETFRHTFTEVGTFEYHCQPHPYMKGTVEVVE